MRHHILRGKAGKRGIGCFAFFESKGHGLARGQSRQGEIGADAVDFRLRQGQGAVAMLGKLGLDLGANNIGAFLMHQDLDARLVFVIAPPFEIIDAENGIGVGEKIGFRQEVADLMRNHGSAAEAAADIDGKAHLAFRVLDDLIADVMHFNRGAILGGAIDRNLELTWQKRIFGMQRRPLPQNFGIGARILDLIGGGASELIGRDIADAIARGLDRVHFDFGEFIENVRAIL